MRNTQKNMANTHPSPENSSRLQRHENAALITVQSFSVEKYPGLQIAHMHLKIRQQQEAEGENYFRNIHGSQKDLGDIPSYYLSPGGNFFIAENQSGLITGFVGLKKDESEVGVGILKRLAVLDEYRGQGIGGQLVGELINWAKINNYSRIRLATGAMEKAKVIYEKHGFKVVGRNEENQDFLMELSIGN